MTSSGRGKHHWKRGCFTYGPPTRCAQTQHWNVHEPVTKATSATRGRKGFNKLLPKQYSCVYCGHSFRLSVFAVTQLDGHTIVDCPAAPTSTKLQLLGKSRSAKIHAQATRKPWYVQATSGTGKGKEGFRAVSPDASSGRGSPPNVTSDGGSATPGVPTTGPRAAKGGGPEPLAAVSPSEGTMDAARVEQMNSSLLDALHEFNVPSIFVDTPSFRDFVSCLSRDGAPHVASAQALLRAKEERRGAASAAGTAAVASAFAAPARADDDKEEDVSPSAAAAAAASAAVASTFGARAKAGGVSPSAAAAAAVASAFAARAKADGDENVTLSAAAAASAAVAFAFAACAMAGDDEKGGVSPSAAAAAAAAPSAAVTSAFAARAKADDDEKEGDDNDDDEDVGDGDEDKDDDVASIRARDRKKPRVSEDDETWKVSIMFNDDQSVEQRNDVV